jgi:peptidoglycan L-alanyl-D-glutamate endopeptidase CwlK
MIDHTKHNNNVNLLSPYFYRRLQKALDAVRQSGYMLEIFEAYRTPARSSYLYEQGRTRDGKIVTNAKAWQSLHNYGLAVDLIYKPDGRWSWEGDFDTPAKIMVAYDFEWLGNKGDKPHYQISGGLSWQEMKAITEQHGLPALWLEVEERIIKAQTKKMQLS